MNIVFKSKFMNELTNEKKLIIDTEIMIPGIAQPEIERLLKTLKKRFFKTLFPKFVKIATDIKRNDVKKISKKVLKLSFKISRFARYSGNFTDQYNI